MAKWGEGDPRWIVEERPDAKNVNNWHWTEKNATTWSENKFEELFNGAVISSDFGECRITGVKADGEAFASNRKRKLIFVYDWNLKLEWKGRVNGNSAEIEGKVEIPNLSDENEINELDVNVTCSNGSSAGEALKNLMRTEGDKKCRSIVEQYLKALKGDFIVGMILPSKDDDNKSNGSVACGTSTAAAAIAKGGCVAPSKTNSSSENGSISTTTVKQKHTFKCTAEDLYRALTEKEMVEQFSRSQCIVEAVENGKFELFSGNVNGIFLKLQPHNKIEMKWRLSGWPANHYSHVKLTIVQKEDTTEIHLEQTNVPSQDVEKTKSGWIQFYWEGMKRFLHFGATLY